MSIHINISYDYFYIRFHSSEYKNWINTSLSNKATKGRIKDKFLSLIINPENRAIAITGENPDHSRLGPKKYLHAVASKTRTPVKRICLLVIFIIDLIE